MSTFSSAIAYETELINYTTASVPFGGSLPNLVLYTNSSSTTNAYFYLYQARRVSGGGASVQLSVTVELLALDHNDSTYYTLGDVAESPMLSYASNGVVNNIEYNVFSNNHINYWSHNFHSSTAPALSMAKIWVPPYHRVQLDLANGGGNGGTFQLTGVIEKYKSNI
jgi:hypothetical protein